MGEGREVPNIDFADWTDEALGELIKQIEDELAYRRRSKKEEVLEKMRQAAAEIGMTPEELLGIGAGRRRRGKRTIAYAHPDDPTKIYRGGKKPAWIKELEKEGREPVKVE